MGTAEKLWSWALKYKFADARCKNALRLLLVTAGILDGWALQDTVRLGSAGILCWLDTAGMIFCGGTLQRHVVVGHCRDTWWLGSAGVLWGWALQG